MKNKGKQELVLNILPFEHPDSIKQFGFFREKGVGRSPLQSFEFPHDFTGNRTENPDILYCDFNKFEDTELQLEIDLRRSCHFAAHYYNYLIYKAMRGLAHYRRRNFINNNQLWFRDESADVQGFRAFKKFILKATVGQYTRGPALTVMFDGHSQVLPTSVLDYSGSTKDLNYVLYKGNCFRYEKIPEDYDIDYSTVYPVVNRTILNHLGKSLPYRRIKNKVGRYYRQIEKFRKEYLMADDFRSAISLDSDWYPVHDRQRYRTPLSSKQLVFRGGNTNDMPMAGIKRFGPYRTPPEKHFRIFFIMHKNDREGAGARLYRALKGDLNKVAGLAELANLPLELTDEHLLFSNEENPYPEVEEYIRQMPQQENVRYMAFYLTPISKEESDEDKHRVYYRIKEVLLKHGITSQVIERQKVTDPNFRYFMPNIAVGVLAKLGGVPWQLNNPPKPELIVGIGAFKGQNMKQRYIGNAFCFSNEGKFYGFECYAKKETGMLAGSIREAVYKYVQAHNDIERLVIHFYKRMSYRERKPIMHMLHNLGLDIPVIVLSINKTESYDTVIFDRNNPEKIPLSGINIKLDKQTHLLCNNTRYKPDDRKLRSYSFPVKIRISATDESILENGAEQGRLIKQVYQFSRIYWKSVAQQNLPVTIKYPEMVAKIFPYFESTVMPQFGKESLWFL